MGWAQPRGAELKAACHRGGKGDHDEPPSASAAEQSKNSSNWLDLSKSDVHLGWGWGEGAGKGLSLW